MWLGWKWTLSFKAINDEATSLTQLERLNAFANVLDKNREVSVQEGIYRLLGLPMTKSSTKVKYLSTIHPHYRDGLLKGNIDELDENDSIFHMSAHQYYECRPYSSIDKHRINYDEDELSPNYWEDPSLADFWSNYEIAYGQKPPKNSRKANLIPMLDNKGYIRKRSEKAILRYYLTYDNDEDMARGLLILFLPFRHELKYIHSQNVKLLLAENHDRMEEK